MRYKCIVSFYAPDRKGRLKRKITMGSLWESTDSLFFSRRPPNQDEIHLKRVWKKNSSFKLDDLIIDSKQLNKYFRQVVVLKNKHWDVVQDVMDGQKDQTETHQDVVRR